VVHLGLEEFDHPLPGKPGIVEVDPPAHQEKGCQRTDDGQQDETAEKPAIVSFSLDIEFPVIDGPIARHRFFLIESTAASPKAACPAGRRLGRGIEKGTDKKLKVMRHMSLTLTVIVIKKHARSAAFSLADRNRRNYRLSHFSARGLLQVEPGRCNLRDDKGWIPNFSLGRERDRTGLADFPEQSKKAGGCGNGLFLQAAHRPGSRGKIHLSSHRLQTGLPE
jgi:hypothetical protein